MTVLAIALAVCCTLVLLETAVFFGHVLTLRRLHRLDPPEPTRWPRVSVIMAARDEAKDVGGAVASRLADDYPDLEVILVDDRSTDGTGERAKDAAAADERFSLVRVDALPKGWLGKVHALERGREAATGDWLLFSDGDVTVDPGTMRRAVAHCEAEGLDMLALLPAFESDSFVVNVVWTVFLRGLFALIDPRAVRSPKRKAAMGCGAINLVRREALARTPGFEHIRLETGDDVALAAMIKRGGGRIEFADGSGVATVASYRSISEMVRGVEKNGSTTAAMPFPLFVLIFVLLFLLLAAPAVSVAVGPPWLALLGTLTLALYTLGEVTALWSNTRRWAPALLWPFGLVVMAYGMIRSTWLAHRNGGVTWRGTFYSLEELAEGRRFRL